MANYTGVKVIETNWEKIEELYRNKKIPIWDNRHSWYQNMYVVVKDASGSNSSALACVKGEEICLIDNKDYNVSGLKPRNKEQRMALDCLLDDEIKVAILTGMAGTGKSLLTIAAALQKIQEKRYDRIIYTRPMSEVGKYKLGTLPGAVNEKFEPFLQGFMCNAEYLLGGKKQNVQDMIQQCKIEFIPIQLFRGASFHNSFIIVDEVQNEPKNVMLAIGTRVAEGSKIVLLGDLLQRDEKIRREATGLYECMNNAKMKESKIASSIELIKSERGEVSTLFGDVFESRD
jgi:PhoH-like ATPase